MTSLCMGVLVLLGWWLIRANWRKRLVAGAVAGCVILSVAIAPPAEGQASLVTAIQGVLNAIHGVIQTALNTMNTVRQAMNDLYQIKTWPVQMINLAKAQVVEMVIQYRTTMQRIQLTDVRSATLPNATAFETVSRNHQVSDFAALGKTYANTFGALPGATAASPADRQMMDMDDAVVVDGLAKLKASDQAADLTIQAANVLEDGAAQAAPGSTPFLTASAVIASIRSQAMTQKMLAAELRQEGARLAHRTALRKRKADSTTELREMIRGLLETK